MQYYQAAGFLKRSLDSAAPRRPSTNRMYDDWWLRFFDTQGLSPQSIKGYRYRLASVLSHTGMAAAVQAKTMSDMITSMELQTRVTVRMTLVLLQWEPTRSLE